MQSLPASTPFCCSWSGGKDACFSLYKMVQAGHQPKTLLTMMNEAGTLSRAHQLPKKLIEQQAASLGLESLLQATSQSDYQSNYQHALQQCKQQGQQHIVLGDIDLQAHRDWQEQQGKLCGITPLFPLWQMDHQSLVDDFIDAGFEATIIAILPDKVPAEFLGKPLNQQTVNQLKALQIDVCAEGGEFHTIVTNGPLFTTPIQLDLQQAKLCTDGDYGYHYLDFA